MAKSKVLAFLSIASLLLISAILVSRRHGIIERRVAASEYQNLKESFHGRSTKKAQHVENLRTSWGSVRVKKMPLSSDARKHEYSLKLDHREKGKSKGRDRIEGTPKGRTGKSKGKGKRSEGKTKSSKKYGKGGKKKKTTSECSFGNGKGKKKESPSSSFEYSCEDFDFRGVSSTPSIPGDTIELEGCGPNVLEQALSLPELSTFVQLVAMAELSCIFHCGGPFTLLAPTNAAFESLNPEAMVELLRHENQVFLQELILEHMLPGLHLSSDVTQSSIDTLLGESIPVESYPFSFDGIDVQTPDIIGCNGVLHILGDVLIPSSETRSPIIADQATQFPTPGRQPDSPVAAPTALDLTAVPTIVAPVDTPDPPSVPPVDPPVAPPVSPPVAPPVNPPIEPPVTSPVTAPAPVAPPVAPPNTPPVSPTMAPSEAVTTTTTNAPTSNVPVPVPTDAPTLSIIETPVPTVSPFLRVELNDVFLALVSPGASAVPRRSEFEALAQLTTTYFDEYLRDFFAGDPAVDFVLVESKLRQAKYGDDAGIPEERYNMYVEFSRVTIVFEHDSNPPNAAEAVELLKASITADYILNIPRMMTGTQFVSTNEAYLSTL